MCIDQFTNNISRISNKKEAVKIPIELVGAAYEFEMWVEKTKKDNKSKDLGAVEVKNKYEPLTDESDEEENTSFHRLVEAM